VLPTVRGYATVVPLSTGELSGGKKLPYPAPEKERANSGRSLILLTAGKEGKFHKPMISLEFIGPKREIQRRVRKRKTEDPNGL